LAFVGLDMIGDNSFDGDLLVYVFAIADKNLSIAPSAYFFLLIDIVARVVNFFISG
jgi:hypothetical protein